MKGLRTFFTLLSGAVHILHFEYGIKPARDTKNFEKDTVYSGNRCKFTSMFICTSLARPCASVAFCRTKFQVPLTALIRHLHFDDQYQYFVKHRKDGFYRKKKNRPLRTVTFHHMKINVLRLLQNFLINFLPHHNPLMDDI